MMMLLYQKLSISFFLIMISCLSLFSDSFKSENNAFTDASLTYLDASSLANAVQKAATGPTEDIKTPILENNASTDTSSTYLDAPSLTSESVSLAGSDLLSEKEEPRSYSKYQSLIEARVGYFFFSDAKMRKIYNQGGWDVQFCGSFPLWRWLQLYASVELLKKEGRSIHGHQKTTIYQIPISLGLKSVFQIFSAMQYYFTVGPRYFFVHQHNKSHYVDKYVNNNGCGGFANTGFYFLPWNGALLIDIFGEYSFKKMHFHAHHKHAYGEER
jgi:hypothetical protein